MLPTCLFEFNSIYNDLFYVILQAWERWNENLQVEYENFDGFDGIDWDLEGKDDGKYDTLSPSVLTLVGEMSQVSIYVWWPVSDDCLYKNQPN